MATEGQGLFPLYTTQFSTNIELLLQQKGSMLRGRLREGFHVGKQASPIQYIGAIQMKAPAGRFEPLQRQDVDFTRRWVFPVDKEASQLIDSFDKLKILRDPTSQYSDVAAAAVSPAAVRRSWSGPPPMKPPERSAPSALAKRSASAAVNGAARTGRPTRRQ